MAVEYARHRAVNPEVLNALTDKAVLTATSRVLEVGCGTGNYIGALRRLSGADCRGVDPSVEMLATAIERHPEVSFELGPAEQLSFASDGFDLVYSVDVIHHVGNHAVFFEAASRILRQGGLFCTVTDSADDIRRRRPLSTCFPETVEAELSRYPEIERLAALMVQAGFGDIKTEQVEFAYPLNKSRRKPSREQQAEK